MLRTWIKSERGQAIVESALVMPIVLLLVIGMVELGRVSNAYMAVMHAARHGARYGAVGGTNEEIVTRVKGAATPLNPSELTVTVFPEHGRQSGMDIQVSVTYPVVLITPLVSSFLSNPVIVRSDITMLVE